ncbi:MAG: ribonucleotide-diphosphate reductase subunit beta [Endomicrobia bacterium]|nr:ribonucleotide-diphosphate reductase subunit beta [Endomicrobiia bacterium]
MIVRDEIRNIINYNPRVVDVDFLLPEDMETPLFEYVNDCIRQRWEAHEIKYDKPEFNLMPENVKLVLKEIFAFFALSEMHVLTNITANLSRLIKHPLLSSLLIIQANEERNHVVTYLQIITNYLGKEETRKLIQQAKNDSIIQKKQNFCEKYLRTLEDIVVNEINLKKYETVRELVKSVLTFGSCVEGLFFYSSFVVIMEYLSRLRLYNTSMLGLIEATNWTIIDETRHTVNALIISKEIDKYTEPSVIESLKEEMKNIIYEAIDIEVEFAQRIQNLAKTGKDFNELSTLSKLDEYVKWLANERYYAIYQQKLFEVENPFPNAIAINNNTNFFEITPVYKMPKKQIENSAFSVDLNL